MFVMIVFVVRTTVYTSTYDREDLIRLSIRESMKGEYRSNFVTLEDTFYLYNIGDRQQKASRRTRKRPPTVFWTTLDNLNT